MTPEEIWLEYTQRSTFHGLERAFNQELKLWRRMVWMFTMLGTFIILLYTLSSGVVKLLHPQYGTQISVEIGTTIDFPQVTFCSKNMFRKSYVESHPELLAYIMRMHPHDISEMLTKNDTLRDLAKDVNVDAIDPAKMASMLKEASHPFNETIYFWKTFDEETIEDESFESVMTDMGVCYRFSGRWTTRYPGQGNGLAIWSHVDYDNYFYNDRDLGAMGIKLLPHAPGEVPSVKSRGIAAGPGVDTVISMEKVVTTLLPDGDCYPRGTNPLELFDNYSRGACIIECATKRNSEHCGCKQFFQPGNYSLCVTEEQFRCIKAVRRNEKGNACVNCHPRCVEETFITKLSWLPFPAPYYRELVPRLRKTVTDKLKAWEKIASITLYFETIDTTSVLETQTYTSSDFFSDVGGLMGLWLGASVLTWAELLGVLFDLCARAGRWRQRSQLNLDSKETPPINTATM